MLLVAVGLVTGLLMKWAGKDSTAVAGARQLPAPAPVTRPPAPASPFATDDRGFVNSAARCDGSQTASAIGRTAGSLVVICAEPGGSYEYFGVRLSDEASLHTAAQTASPRGFLARNYSVTYAVSPTELLVTAGDRVIKHEPMIEYRELRGQSAGPAPR
ncbi:hypothetical protein [Mycobacterium hubeiense]|uniref:hypothetical protein n=1 Tax=Mycobacterium hubeiense TaxID=1867256 RepID=UPI000C7EE54B|nr:hypothetical protein [Mycobacterium sp. QGD 101]